MKESLYISRSGKGGMLSGYLLENPFPYEFLSEMCKVPGVLNLLGRHWEEIMDIFAYDIANQLDRDGHVFLDYAREAVRSYMAERTYFDLRQVDLIGYGFAKDTSVDDAICYAQELADRYITYLFEFKFNDNYSWVQKAKNSRALADDSHYITPSYLSGMMLDKFSHWFNAFHTYPATLVAELTLALMVEKGPGAEITKFEISDLVIREMDNARQRVDVVRKISEMFDICAAIKNNRIEKEANAEYWDILIRNISDGKSLDTFLMANSIADRSKKCTSEFQQAVRAEVARICYKVASSSSFSINMLNEDGVGRVIKQSYREAPRMAADFVGQCFVNALHGYDTSTYNACPNESAQLAYRRNSGSKDSVGMSA
jgi:hypothetical protein